MIDRMLRAAKLDVTLYREVEQDPSAIKQAVLVVALVSLITGLGATGQVGPLGIVSGIIGGVLGWLVLSGLVYLVGVTILGTPHTEASWGQLLRAMGFAQTPNLLAFLLAIPVLGWLIWLVLAIWTLMTATVAARTTLNFTSTFRALATVVIAWLGLVIVRGLLIASLGLT